MVLQLTLGRYAYYATPQSNYYLIHSLPEVHWSVTDERIKSYDHILHQSLNKIFRKRYLSSSEQVKEFLRSPLLKSIIKPILDQEPVLSRHFSEQKLGQLPFLWIAVLGGYEQSSELLVRYGADVNERFGRRYPQVIDEKWTVLHLLLQMRPSHENKRLIRLVMDHGADLQARDYKGKTVLHYAVEKGQVPMIEILLKKGADVNLADNLGVTPLLMVVAGMTSLPMSMTGTTIHKELLQLLIKHGANLQARDNMGQTALHLAIERNQVQVTELLLEKGADVNAANKEDLTPLLVAVSKLLFNVNELVPLLMKYGADLEARDHNGQTALHYTVRACQVEMTEMLLEKGADVNVVDNKGSTPLLDAVRSMRDNELIQLLMKHGADVFAKDREGMNALHHLSTSVQQNLELARFLIAKGVSINDRAGDELYQPIHLAVEIGSNELVELFLDHGANVNSLTKKGASPLYIATQLIQDRVVKTLLECGADVDLKTIEGDTPLHAACLRASMRFGHLENIRSIVVRLLNAGANVLSKDNDGRTPLALMTSTVNGAELGQESLLLIKALALKKALKPSIKLKDKMIIQRHSTLHYHYQKCFKELESMKCTKFIEKCSFFDILAKSQCQIAAIMRKPEFETMYRLYDINDVFPIYAGDLLRALERAQRGYHAMPRQANNKRVCSLL